jgi:hypothetical protein
MMRLNMFKWQALLFEQVQEVFGWVGPVSNLRAAYI